MKRSVILVASLAVILCCYSIQAMWTPIPVIVRGTISGEVQDGDVLFLRFIYSRKRVESSSPQPPRGLTFTVTGAYSTFKKHGIFVADICGGYPRQIELVMQDKNGTTLDTVDLKTPDPSNGVVEMNYGKAQSIVLHPRSVAASIVGEKIP